MNEQELRELLAAKHEAFTTAKSEKNMDEARSISKEIKETRELLDMELSVQANNVPDVVATKQAKIQEGGKRNISEMKEAEVNEAYTPVFLKAVRKQKLNDEDYEIFNKIKEMRAVPSATPYLKSGTDEDGGLIIPKDIETRINEYKRQFSFELQSLVSVEPTSLLSGSRVFEKLADSVAWSKVNQWDNFEEVESPQFENKSYEIEDYGGVLPIPRTMLQDTDATLMNTIAKHIARKTIITRNKEILNVIDTTYSSKEELTSIDDFKDAINVTLDPAFAETAQIITNQDGFNKLDKMKDEDGNYLLQPDVTSPTGKALFGKQVILIPNRDLPSASTVAPVYIGSMQDAVVLFDRGVYEITGTAVGGDSFKRNSYDIRVIDRFDVQLWDKEAVFAGEIETVELP